MLLPALISARVMLDLTGFMPEYLAGAPRLPGGGGGGGGGGAAIGEDLFIAGAGGGIVWFMGGGIGGSGLL